MQFRTLHAWNLTVAEARALQQQLRRRVSHADAVKPGEARLVVGVDNGYVGVGARVTACSAAVAIELPTVQTIETRTACVPIDFPYVPGLLAFRELPAMLAVLRELEQEPDVVLVDAHGYAHPRRMGAASHLGLWLDRPTIGCAKSRLIGQYREPANDFGAWTPLVDGGEVIGAVVRTRPGAAPLFVSVGHRVSLPTAIAIVLACCTGRSLMPEPTRLADALVRRETRARRGAPRSANG